MLPSTVQLAFEYTDVERAALIERSVRQEVGEIDGGRSRTTIERDNATVELFIEADDLVALRAGLNTWCTLLDVAERCSKR
ncbi:KEOPS complex subunit Pcc1 [Halocatena salina]|uniref:Rpo operon protein n=1 Tax=Halocatena salina TaxID=2934340 RepID=A0A8U0A7K6_9EURY|nr:KEOPS complex subunit Pcc1 [Halocatena salina]UPM43993.1 rpo operon protein [Halocatena salina]